MKKPIVCFFGTYDKTYTSNRLVLDGLKAQGVTVYEVNAHIPVTTLTKKSEMTFGQILKRILKKYRLVSEVIKHRAEIQKSDVIYVGYPGHVDVLPAWIVAKLFKKKLVFNPLLIIYTGFSEEQGILNKQSLLGTLIKSAESLVYNLCDIVFADTPFQQTYLEEVFGVSPEKIRVLAIGADAKYYRYTPYTNTSKKINVTYYGLYSPIHGVEYLVEAARLLKKESGIKFVFVGQGNKFQENFDRVKRLGLKNITFYHDIPMEKHADIIVKADIFLGFLAKHPSVERIIPNKVYQGLALNKVVLTATAPVTRSMFTHGENMYLVPPADPKALAKSLLALKNNPALRRSIATNGYALFQKRFSPKAVGHALVGFMSELL